MQMMGLISGEGFVAVVVQRLVSVLAGRSSGASGRRATYGQGGAAGEAALGAQPGAHLVRGAVGHEGPLDDPLGRLVEGEDPRDLHSEEHSGGAGGEHAPSLLSVGGRCEENARIFKKCGVVPSLLFLFTVPTCVLVCVCL